MPTRTCPKCSASMHGPEWSAASDLLHWRCACGYRDTTRPADRDNETIREKLAQMGITLQRKD